MTADWPILTLGDVCEKITDGAHNSPKSVKQGKPMASVKDLTRFGVDLSEARLISQEEFDELVKQGCQPEVGDVLIAKDGNSALDTVCTVDALLEAVMLSSVAILRPDKAKLDSDFLKYYFCSKQVLDYLKNNFISGAAIPRVVLKDFRKAEIKVPPLDTQKEISKRLQMLDDKIELNRQTNQTLENIAQAIFKSWFVDFEPIRAKIAAKQNGQDPERAAMATINGKTIEELNQLSPEKQQTLKTTAALFPDTLVDSELGEIPEGWGVGSIGDIAMAKGGYAFKGKSFVDKGHPVVKIKNITGDGRVDLSSSVCIDDEQANSSERFKLHDGDLLMAMTGATVAKIGLVVTDGKSVYLNQRVAKFESEQFGSQISWFLFCCFGRESIIETVIGAAQGSAQPNISSTEIEATKLVLPSGNLIGEFCKKSDSLFEKWISNIKENSILENYRDALLPKLLSGELNIDSEEVA